MSARYVDARGLKCPWPALRLARAMKDADAVEILADDPRAEAEFRALAEAHGWTVRPAVQGYHVTRAAAGDLLTDSPA